MTLNERIALAIKESGVSQKEIASRVGVSPGAITMWKNGDTKRLEAQNLLKLAAITKVQPDWLASGIGPMRAGDLSEQELSEGPTLMPFRDVPVVGHAQLGDNGHWAELEYPVGNGDGYVAWPTRDPNAYALRCVGNSMMPRIKQGEFVVVEPNTPYMNGDEVMVKTADERVMVKQFLYERDGIYCLVSINGDHPPIELQKEQIEKIHFVAGIARRSNCRKFCGPA